MARKDKNIEKSAEERLKEEAVLSPSKVAFRNFFRNRLGVIGLVGFILISLIVFIGSAVMEYDPYYSQGIMKNISPGSGYMNVPSELKNEGIKRISTGTTFSVGLSEEGKFYVWGHKPAFNQPIPQEILDNQGKIKDVAAGDNHIIVLTEDDEVYGYGQDNHNQTKIPSDIKTFAQKDGGIASIGASDLYSYILTGNGTIKVWGAIMPTGLNMISKDLNGQIAEVEAASTNMLVRLKDGTVRVLGTKGTEIDTQLPEDLKTGKVRVKEIARMRYSGLAVTEDGENIVWGSSLDNIKSIPEMDGKVIKAESGREHITVLTDTGHVYSWGKDNYGELAFPSGENYKDIFVGYFNNYAITDDNSVDTWGLDGFLMGSDDQGRDLFTRVVNGGKMTLIIALVAVVIQILLGVLVGIISGYYGKIVDNILSRFGEIISSFPFYPLIITLAALLPVDTDQYKRLIMIMVILGLLGWPGIARLVRGEILSEREKDYITAAKALGLKEKSIMASHMIPNILSIIIVNATIGYAGALLTEAGLSFLGFGVQDPYPSWGNILNAAQNIDVLEQYWWRWVFPGLAVFITALTVNLVGDALRDALDPRSQER